MLRNAKNGSVPLGDTEMDYVRFGRGRRAFVLLPGLSDGLTTVKGKALLLARPYRMFFDRYTVYVFSRKNRMPEGYSIRDMARDQALAMEALGMESACVMGVSEGGMIAQLLAADRPALVEKLVLAVTAPEIADITRENLARWTGYAERGDHRSLMIDTAEMSYTEARLKRLRPLYPFLGLIGRPKDYDRFLLNIAAIRAFEARGALGGIACPTLVIGGEKDMIVGIEGSYALREGIAGSRLHIYPGLGHAAFEEAPDFNERVLRFLDS